MNIDQLLAELALLKSVLDAMPTSRQLQAALLVNRTAQSKLAQAIHTDFAGGEPITDPEQFRQNCDQLHRLERLETELLKQLQVVQNAQIRVNDLEIEIIMLLKYS